MPRTTSSLILVALAALSLGGCKSMLTALGFQRHSIRAVDVTYQEGTESYLAGQLAAGRRALDEGRYAAAITAFSAIRNEPGYAGDANNGMAIAYLNIGRPDLAESYFQRAISSAPQNERFRRNLAAFRNSNPAASSRAGLLAQAEPSGTQTAMSMPGRQVMRGIRIDDRTSPLIRVSSGEVYLPSDTSVALWEPARPRATIRLALVHAGDRKAAAGTRPSQPRSVYPVRLQVGTKASRSR